MGKGRLEAFSDGVIAIIITIMVLELKIPEGKDLHALITLTPIFLSYVLSFAFVGIYWNNHHHLLHVVKKISAGIMWANLNLLFWLSLVPFATDWVGENHFEKLSVAVYASLLDMCGIAYTILQYAILNHHKNETELKDLLERQRAKGLTSLIIYTSAIALAFIHPYISCGLFVAVAIMWMIPDKRIEKAAGE